jgi:hypothetical protein
MDNEAGAQFAFLPRGRLSNSLAVNNKPVTPIISTFGILMVPFTLWINTLREYEAATMGMHDPR